ncbi:hypothetical protein HOB10_00215 [Candidatus Parcubacteria bacterium]|jgi:hypothetical protein|nr:hypothetical protein [Candidatus Parcubacteria bacterium]
MDICTLAQDGEKVRWVKKEHLRLDDLRKDQSLLEVVLNFHASLGLDFQQVHWLVFSQYEHQKLQEIAEQFMFSRGSICSIFINCLVCDRRMIGLRQIFATYVAEDPNIPLAEAEMLLAIQFGHHTTGQKRII